jgi:hypothetical protein
VTHTTSLGMFYTVAGETDAHVAGGHPIEPLTSRDVHIQSTIAHGALMVGGAFSNQAIDPHISRVVTDALYVPDEPVYPTAQWYPLQMGTINRFLAIDGQSRERLVVVPGQFQATGITAPTKGVQRLYSSLDYEVYHAPFTATDFIAPNIWRVEAIRNSVLLKFRVQVSDDSGVIQRTVVLYRTLSSGVWQKAELAYNAATGWAEGNVPPVIGPIEYFAQAVDGTGNVALALDHGNPFTGSRAGLMLYLPVVLKK